MNLVVKRLYSTELSTTGELFIFGEHFCWTLEPPSGPMLIPEGTYPIEILMSKRFGEPVPHIQNVPGHDAEEIHPGNFPNDTHGCLLPGFTKDLNYVGYSQVAFDALLLQLRRAKDGLTISYTHENSQGEKRS